jgi:hypothetical protein
MARPGSDSGNLDFPSPTEAHHNEKGMYVMNDNNGGSVPTGGMVETESGLFVPAPSFKPMRRIQALGNGTVMSIEVEETVDEVKAIIADAVDGGWVTFTDPVYGNAVHVQTAVLRQPLVIIEDYKDLDLLTDQMKEYERSRSLQRIQQASQNKSANILEQYRNRKK